MKEPILSTCEKSFILKALAENPSLRLDGRSVDEFRPVKIHFGSDWGCCLVTYGETKVLVQVSCEVQQPKPTRPNEGLLLLYVELSPMGAPHFEAGRQSDLAVQLNRLLEKCIKDSRCVDLESLCITAEEKVWAVRVDINILNHEGNLIDAASVAALAALSHFRRPDVTTTGEQTIIHDPAERDPIPITLHHHPVCISYAIFDKGSYVVADPTAIEERVSEGQIVFGVNAYRELCGLHLGGNAPITMEMVLQYASRAERRALALVNQIKSALEEDVKARNLGAEVGFKECIEGSNKLSLGQDNFFIQLNRNNIVGEVKDVSLVQKNEEIVCDSDGESVVVPLGKGSAELVDSKQEIRRYGGKEGSPDSEEDESEETSSDSSLDEKPCIIAHSPPAKKEVEEDVSDSEIQVVAEFTGTKKPNAKKVVARIDLGGDSEEEETVVLHGEDLKRGPAAPPPKKTQKKKKNEDSQVHSRGWYSKPSW